MGASSDTPSSTQADRLLTAIEQLNRNVERIQRQLETAGLVLYVAANIAVASFFVLLITRRGGS